MDISCCFPIRDHPSEDSDGSYSGNYLVSEFHSIFHKVKGIFHGNEVYLTYPAQPRAASVNAGVTTEILNTSSCRGHPNVEHNLPVVAVILDKAASVNAGVTAEILNTSSSLDHPKVESGHQSSEKNPEVGVILEEAAASVNAGAPESLNTSSGHVQPNVESGDHQSLEQNPGVDAVLDRAASSVNEGVTEILNPSSCHVHQNVESGQSSEQNSKEEILPTQTELNSCTKEASLILEKSLVTKPDSLYYEVFPSSDEEDVCPTCLEDYEPDNPRIVAECSHHFHLSCIYEWMERSEHCPICFRLMVIGENN